MYIAKCLYYVYTYFSFKERVIVVRDVNGTLRKATPDERHRMNETYYPRPGRKLRMPHMFEKEHLKVKVWCSTEK
jgi:small subunit ribosomal protein S22